MELIKCIECFDKFPKSEINISMGVNLCKECYKQNLGYGQEVKPTKTIDITAVEFLREKGILSKDCEHFIIDFDDDRSFELNELLEEYHKRKLNEPINNNVCDCGSGETNFHKEIGCKDCC